MKMFSNGFNLLLLAVFFALIAVFLYFMDCTNDYELDGSGRVHVALVDIILLLISHFFQPCVFTSSKTAAGLAWSPLNNACYGACFYLLLSFRYKNQSLLTFVLNSLSKPCGHLVCTCTSCSYGESIFFKDVLNHT